MKCRNPTFGYVRIAQQISYAFGVDIDKDVVRRVLAKHYRPNNSGSHGPSWLTFIGHTKDSLWSIDLFRCESILLRSHWVMVVMDVFTRRLVGFGVETANIDGVSVCRMFNHAIAGQPLPKHVSTDHDLLFRFHRWRANLRVLEIEEVKSVPYMPASHPFVERLIGTLRREYLDRVFFWNGADLARKLNNFRDYYNTHRVHRSLDGTTPAQRAGALSPTPLRLIAMLGSSIVAVCLRSRSPLDYEFATHTIVKARRTAPDQLRRIETEIRRLKRELDRFVSLIASGQAPQRVLEEITAREKQVYELELERERLEAAVPNASETERIRRFAHERISRIRDTLQNDVPGAREALKQILDGPDQL